MQPNTIQTADGAKGSKLSKGQLVRAYLHNCCVRMCTHTQTQLGIVSMTGGTHWYTSERKRRGRDRRSARQTNTAAPLCVCAFFFFFSSTFTDSHRKEAVRLSCRLDPGLMANGPACRLCPSRPPFFPSRRTNIPGTTPSNTPHPTRLWTTAPTQAD